MKDPLLAEIAAHPESDDARLVWADREGGDRGELVVIQCALAAGKGTRPERKRLYARERELLERAVKWPEASALEDPRFERGFITHASVKIDDVPKHLARHPLLTSIELADARVDISGGYPAPPWSDTGRRLARVFDDLPPGRVAKVKANPWLWIDQGPIPHVEDHLEGFLGALSGTHAGRALRGLELVRPFPFEAFPWLAKWTELEELRIECDRYGMVALTHFVDLHPKLTRLQLRSLSRGFAELPRMSSFTELDFHSGLDEGDVGWLGRQPLTSLRRLGIAWCRAPDSYGFDQLAASESLPRLEALDVSGTQLDDATLALSARAKLAPNLRVLEARDTNKLTAASIPHLLSFPKLDRLDLRSSYGDTTALAPVADVIPWVAR